MNFCLLLLSEVKLFLKTSLLLLSEIWLRILPVLNWHTADINESHRHYLHLGEGNALKECTSINHVTSLMGYLQSGMYWQCEGHVVKNK